MILRFVNKKNHFVRIKEKPLVVNNPIEERKKTATKAEKKNKNEKKEVDMNTMEQVNAAEIAVEKLNPEVKVVKKDRGLIERTESSKIILTEDNRQVLND